jgi:hypothetical protein
MLDSTIEQTNWAGTARFEGMTHDGGPLGPAPRRFAQEVVGITDFLTRRAIVRDLLTPAGFRAGLAGRTEHLARTDGALIQFCEGPSMCGALPPGKWGELYPQWPAILPRKPLALEFLDLLRPEAIAEQRVLGQDEVRGAQTSHFALTLTFSREDWPKPTRDASAAAGHSLLSRLAVRTLPDPRPDGAMDAQAWIDQDGRLRRFSWSTSDARINAAKVVWTTTELWDFGGPPPIADRLSQPVIDPVTGELVTIGPQIE